MVMGWVFTSCVCNVIFVFFFVSCYCSKIVGAISVIGIHTTQRGGLLHSEI